MNIQKGKLEVLLNFTKGTTGLLTLAESRIRDTFAKGVADKTQEYLNEREEIYKHFCIKKEDGTPDLKDGNKYQFNPADLDAINAELKTLADEEVEITKPDGIKEILEKSEYKPQMGEAEIIDELVTLF